MGMQTSTDRAALVDQQSERRQVGRIPFRVPLRATIYAPPGCKGDTARFCHLLAQDLSGTGVGLVYARPFPIGQRIELEMPDRDRQAVVCRVTSMSDGHYLIGCEFVD